jgi:serine/threonine-protein kinase
MGRAEAERVEGDQPRHRSSLKLGKYQLLAVLGRGGMAEVFLALSRGAMGFDKLAVIKRLRPGLADDEGFRTMFLDEARLAARLNHPNVVHTYEVGEHEGVYYIAMEYLEGQPLNKVAFETQKRGTPLDPVVVARIISDALLGLHHAHTLKDFDGRPLGIIHRDISPHNLFVTYEGTTKLVDFGIAKAALSSTETEVGVLKGKVAYMSPEQARGAVLDPRSDVFAMGIVLWELLTQRRLMTGDSAASTIHRLLTAPVPPASSLRGDVAPTLDAIVERALQKDPALRYPSALAMREALEAYITSTGRAVRNEEIGEQIAGMFVGVREAIQKQIQEHVEGVAAGGEEASESVRASTMEALQGTGDLPVLLEAAGNSSSGLVPRSSGGTALSAGVPPPPSATAAVAAIPPSPAKAPSQAGRIAAIAGLVVLVIGTSVATQVFLGQKPPPPPTDSFSSPAAPAAPPPPSTALAAAPASPPPTPSPVASAAPAAQPAPQPGKTTRPGRAAATPPPASTEGGGFFTFDTYPWTRVTEGNAALGTTPLVHVPLSAGTHTLTLDNPDQGIHQTYMVTIKQGESVTKRLGLK